MSSIWQISISQVRLELFSHWGQKYVKKKNKDTKNPKMNISISLISQMYEKCNPKSDRPLF